MAATLYNLGRIEEAEGPKDAAIAALRRSYLEWSSAVVLARLATLDPAAAAALDPFVPVALAPRRPLRRRGVRRQDA